MPEDVPRGHEEEWQVEFVTGVDLDRKGYARIDTTVDAENGWRTEMEQMAAKTPYHHADSWYVGANIADTLSIDWTECLFRISRRTRGRAR